MIVPGITRFAGPGGTDEIIDAVEWGAPDEAVPRGTRAGGESWWHATRLGRQACRLKSRTIASITSGSSVAESTGTLSILVRSAMFPSIIRSRWAAPWHKRLGRPVRGSRPRITSEPT